MEKISAIIICHNEEENIRDCLKSLNWVDEIVVIDSFSTDKTVEICQEYTDKVFTHPFEDFIKQKNYAVEKTNNSWILNIDADERISSELAEEIQTIFKENKEQDYAGFYVPIRPFYCGKWIYHSGWYPGFKIRLFDKRKGRWKGVRIHEKVEVKGKICTFKNDILHYGFRNINDHLQTVSKYSTEAAQELFLQKSSFRWADVTIRPIVSFFKFYILKQGFLDGSRGFIISVISSFAVFCKYIKLWELYKGND